MEHNYSEATFESVMLDAMVLTRLSKGKKKRTRQLTVTQNPKPPKQGRNEHCICRSGKKYKNCCGKD